MNKSILIHPDGTGYVDFWDGSTNCDILGGTESMLLGLAKYLAKKGVFLKQIRFGMNINGNV